MSKRNVLLNALLLVACLFVGRAVYRDYQEFNEGHVAQEVTPEKVDGDAAGRPRNPGSLLPVPPETFMIVADKNLFLQSRSVQVAEPQAVAEPVPQLNPKPLLMGVAVIGNEARAFIQNVRTRPGQKASQTLRPGEIYEGYRVSAILSDRVELVYTAPSGTTTTQVLDLNDPAKKRTPVPTARTPVAQSQVITVGGSIANPAAQAAQGQAGVTVDEQGRRVIKTPFGDRVVEPAGGAAAQIQALQQLAIQAQAAQSQASPSQPVRRGEIIDEKGRRIIRTPFGDVVRPPDPNPSPPPPPPPPLE